MLVSEAKTISLSLMLFEIGLEDVEGQGGDIMAAVRYGTGC